MKVWIYIFVLLCMVAYGQENVTKGDPYKYLSNSCVCEKLGPGLHPTFDSEHYCVCKLMGKDNDEIKEFRSFRRHRKCPKGMYFNPLIVNCDYKGEGYVKPRRPQPEDYKCPEANGYFRYPGQCSMFIICSNNIPHTDFCPADLHFCESCKTQGCKYAHDADCPERSTDSGNTVVPVTEDKTTEVINDKIQTTTVSIKSTPIPLPSEKLDCPYPNGLLPYARDCGKFWQCNGKIGHLMTCAKTTYFDPVFRVCSFRSSFCKNGKPVNKEISLPQGRCCSNYQLERDEQDCSKVYICHDGNLFHETCGIGENFDGNNECLQNEEVKKKCPKPAEILQNVEHCKACKTSECKVPDPTSPYHYYQCNGMKAKKFNCHLGQTFNSETSECKLMKGNCKN